MRLTFFFLSLIFLLSGSFVDSKLHADSEIPPELQGIKIDAKPGTQVPLQTVFTDYQGKEVSLQNYFQNNRPVILTLNYYGCATLCTLELNNIEKALSEKELELTPGNDFQVMTISIDSRESPSLAQAKREAYLLQLKKDREEKLKAKNKNIPEDTWTFLTGSQASISFLTDTVGFRYRYDAATNQFAHTSGIYILTPAGKISQVLDGMSVTGETLRLALVEASEGKLGSFSDRILLWCYHYDYKVGKYTAAAWKIMRMAGVVTVIGLILFLGSLWRKERSRQEVRHE